MRLLLFDIDGTLLRCGPQVRVLFAEALHEVFGTAGDLDRYDFSGKTDPLIVRELMTAAGVPADEVRVRMPRMRDAYVAASRRGWGRWRSSPAPPRCWRRSAGRRRGGGAGPGKWHRRRRRQAAPRAASTATSPSAPTAETRGPRLPAALAIARAAPHRLSVRAGRRDDHRRQRSRTCAAPSPARCRLAVASGLDHPRRAARGGDTEVVSAPRHRPPRMLRGRLLPSWRP